MAASTKAGRKDDPAMSFAMLTDSEVMPARQALESNENMNAKPKPTQTNRDIQDNPAHANQALSHQIETATRLFEVLSSRSDIDHPVCLECTELLLSSLKSRLDVSTKERDAYITFLKTLNNSTPTPSEVSKAQAALATSRAAESKAFAELQALENEKAGLEEEVMELEAESLALDEEEESFWRSRNAFALDLSSFRNESDALHAAYNHDTKQLEQLQRTKVYNDAFFITSEKIFDFNFATINGLRLGRLPPKVPVDWAEINAAWGYAALLLATIADKLGFVFRGYKLKPMGSMSRIEEEHYPSPQNSTSKNRQPTGPQAQKPKIVALDLFSSGDLPLVNAVIHRRINNGMVAFLECLRQLAEFVERGGINTQSSPSRNNDARNMNPVSVGFKLPYKIKGDKIGEDKKGYMSIKLNASNDAEWTEACKYTLTCCKYLLAVMDPILDARGR